MQRQRQEHAVATTPEHSCNGPSPAGAPGWAGYAAGVAQPHFSRTEDTLCELLDQPNLAATVIPEGFKPSKVQMLDALIAAKARQRAAEIEQVSLVSGLCDAYSCLESNPGGDVEDPARVLFGEHLLPPSMDGVPAIAEFFGHELGPALGISPDSAWILVWDVLALRHRHPILWEHTLTGQVEVWRARKVANACHSLTAELAPPIPAPRSDSGPEPPAEPAAGTTGAVPPPRSHRTRQSQRRHPQSTATPGSPASTVKPHPSESNSHTPPPTGACAPDSPVDRAPTGMPAKRFTE